MSVTGNSDGLSNVLAGAMRLLAAREHSQHELRRKLSQKGHATEDIERAIEQLAAQNLQSDARFVESFVNSHRQRGKGPKRIRLELQQHQLAEGLVDEYLNERDDAWKESALEVKLKKFGEALPDDFQQQMKQAKFLEYRGFTHEQISAVLKTGDA
ncbi:MAG: regulatory protein RecX [Thioalkalispiraceae bacterium]|jgi:regulatory protein